MIGGGVIVREERKIKRNVYKTATLAVSVLLTIFALSFIPTFFLKTGKMNELKGKYITVFYEQEKAAAQGVFELAEAESERIASVLGFTEVQDIRMYIYDQQSVFQTKKYGLTALLINLQWYIGDNRGTNVLITSPANPGTEHGYEEVRHAAIHEMVHAYNSIINKRMPLWVNEGLALYLTNGNPPKNLFSTSRFIPNLQQMRTKSPVEFANIGGYHFAHTYIEYLDKTFGWESVLALARGGNYQGIFGMDEIDIYEGWLAFLEENYS